MVDVTVGGGSITTGNTLRKVFDHWDYANASGNDASCFDIAFEYDEGGAPKVASYVTINQFGFEARPPGSYYDDISLYTYFGSDFPDENGDPYDAQFGWNRGTPDDLEMDFGTFKYTCNMPGYPFCNDLTQQDIDEIFCLQFNELNYYLDSEENIVSRCATFFQKDFISLTAYFEATGSGRYFWIGDQHNGVLKIRPEGYTIAQIQAPGNGCTCR